MKLNIPLFFNDDIQPVCLPSLNWAPDTNPDNQCFVSGWGHTSYEGESPEYLQWVKLPAVSNDVCSQANGNAFTDSVICAGHNYGGKSACTGDSGGPFVCLNGTDAIITGIVSYVYECGYPGYYGGFARVTRILDWIESNMV